jgi:hypothetical protein
MQTINFTDEEKERILGRSKVITIRVEDEVGKYKSGPARIEGTDILIFIKAVHGGYLGFRGAPYFREEPIDVDDHHLLDVLEFELLENVNSTCKLTEYSRV